MIRAAVFDVGETLVDETRQWTEWAEWLGVPALTFLAAFGAVIARGEHHRAVFDIFEPGFDMARAQAARTRAGRAYAIEPRDLYPDALGALRAVRELGLEVAIAGNQPEAAEAALLACGVEVDFIASSARWGVEKPAAAFFERIVAEAAAQRGEILYVGNRLDNDVRPAKGAGLKTAFLLRGPWAIIQARGEISAGEADLRLEGLAALAPALAAWNAR